MNILIPNMRIELARSKINLLLAFPHST